MALYIGKTTGLQLSKSPSGSEVLALRDVYLLVLALRDVYLLVLVLRDVYLLVLVLRDVYLLVLVLKDVYLLVLALRDVYLLVLALRDVYLLVLLLPSYIALLIICGVFVNGPYAIITTAVAIDLVSDLATNTLCGVKGSTHMHTVH